MTHVPFWCHAPGLEGLERRGHDVRVGAVQRPDELLQLCLRRGLQLGVQLLLGDATTDRLASLSVAECKISSKEATMILIVKRSLI